MKLKVAGFLDNTVTNGEGLRCALFLSGCYHNCIGCQNKAMQDFSYGEDVEIDDIVKRINHNIPLIRGVTFSGGEPFEQANGLCILADKLKKKDINIWCYTGYTFEEIVNSNSTNKLNLLKHVDVLVDGKFEKDLTEGAPKYVGSRNQRIIDVKKSLIKKTVVSYKKAKK